MSSIGSLTTAQCKFVVHSLALSAHVVFAPAKVWLQCDVQHAASCDKATNSARNALSVSSLNVPSSHVQSDERKVASSSTVATDEPTRSLSMAHSSQGVIQFQANLPSDSVNTQGTSGGPRERSHGAVGTLPTTFPPASSLSTPGAPAAGGGSLGSTSSSGPSSFSQSVRAAAASATSAAGTSNASHSSMICDDNDEDAEMEDDISTNSGAQAMLYGQQTNAPMSQTPQPRGNSWQSFANSSLRHNGRSGGGEAVAQYSSNSLLNAPWSFPRPSGFDSPLPGEDIVARARIAFQQRRQAMFRRMLTDRSFPPVPKEFTTPSKTCPSASRSCYSLPVMCTTDKPNPSQSENKPQTKSSVQNLLRGKSKRDVAAQGHRGFSSSSGIPSHSSKTGVSHSLSSQFRKTAEPSAGTLMNASPHKSLSNNSLPSSSSSSSSSSSHLVRAAAHNHTSSASSRANVAVPTVAAGAASSSTANEKSMESQVRASVPNADASAPSANSRVPQPKGHTSSSTLPSPSQTTSRAASSPASSAPFATQGASTGSAAAAR